jgi:hypothetical protein
MNNKENKIKPVIILPKGEMSKKDLKRLNENGFIVVEAKDPSTVRFCEPPPLGYSIQEKAAISLCRYLLNRGGYNYDKKEISELYAHFIINGSTLKEVQKVKS